MSLVSARSVINALNCEKYKIIPIGITKEGYWMLGDTVLDELSRGETTGGTRSIPDFLSLSLEVVFPVLHGPYGEDGRLQ